MSAEPPAELHELYRSLIEASPDAGVVIDLEGTIVTLNQRAVDAFRFASVADAVGTDGFDLVAPEDRDRTLAALRQMEVPVGHHSGEYMLMRRDGTVFPAEATYSVVGDDLSTTANVVVFSRDISQRKTAQDALRESEARYRVLVEAAHDIIFIIDRDDIVRYVNSVAAEFLGLPAGDVVGERRGLLFPADDPATRRQAENVRRVLDNGEPTYVEDCVTTLSGAVIYLGTSLSPIRGEKGEVTSVLGIARDITAGKLAERAASEARINLEAMIDAAPVSIMTLDAEGRVTAWNPASERVFGWNAAEVMGEVQPTTPDEEMPAFRGRMRRVLAGEMFSELEVRRLRKDGRLIDVSLSAAPVRDSTGAIVGVVGIQADITERKRLAAALTRYRLLSDTTRDIVLFVGYDDGHILDANTAALRTYGYSRDELLAMSVVDLRTPETVSHIREQMDRAFEEGLLFETVHRRKDGSTFPVEVSSRGATIEGQRVLASIVRDITERRKLDELKSDFVSIVSHELRTPLTSIIGYAALLERSEGVESQQLLAQIVPKIRQRSEDMKRMVEDVLNVVRIQAGRLDLQIGPTDLDQLVRGCIDSFGAPDGERIDLELGLHDEPMHCDADRMFWAVCNLISNAVKYSPEGGRILVKAWQEDDTTRISVTDHGVGISPEDTGRVFDRFTQVDTSTTRPFGGFGLGLYIVREIVEAHGGRVGVASELGSGSTFTIAVPTAGPSIAHQASSAPKEET